MDSILNMEFCQRLVQVASLATDHNVLITDDKGIVLASSDQIRISTLHEASLEVINSRKMAYHGKTEAGHLLGTRPGMTAPILLNDVPVGTIGITGSPEEISRYAVLIQQLSQIFLDFQNRQQMAYQLDCRRQNLLREILSFHPLTQDEKKLNQNAYELGINLNLPRAAVVFHIQKSKGPPTNEEILEHLTKHFSKGQDLVYMQNEKEYVILTFLEEGVNGQTETVLYELCQNTLSQLEEEGISAKCGIGTSASSVETLHLSYQDAKFALYVLEQCRRPEDTCLAIGQAVFEKLAAGLPEGICREMISNYFQALWSSKRQREAFHLVACWCQSQFHFGLTAQMLHIHKSTLSYRFQRFHTLYGINLYDFDRAAALYLLLLRERLR